MRACKVTSVCASLNEQLKIVKMCSRTRPGTGPLPLVHRYAGQEAGHQEESRGGEGLCGCLSVYRARTLSLPKDIGRCPWNAAWNHLIKKKREEWANVMLPVGFPSSIRHHSNYILIVHKDDSSIRGKYWISWTSWY